MKMAERIYEGLRAAIEEIDTPERRAVYAARDFPRAELVRDLDRRYRWDLFYDAQLSFWLAGYTIPAELDDSHIDTALRRIVPTL